MLRKIKPRAEAGHIPMLFTALILYRKNTTRMLLALAIVLSSFLLVLLYVFFAPIYIEVDSNAGLYRLRLHRVASISLLVEERIYIAVKILGWTRRTAILLNSTIIEKKENLHSEPVIKKQKRNHSLSAASVKALIQSFKIKTCVITIDTGNMQWNGMLYPAFYWLGWYSGHNIAINFTGNNRVLLKIQNNMARMSRALIRSN